MLGLVGLARGTSNRAGQQYVLSQSVNASSLVKLPWGGGGGGGGVAVAPPASMLATTTIDSIYRHV